MRHKDEVLDVFLKWKKLIETQIGRKIKQLRSNNGGEYKSDPFLKVCQDEGIVCHLTIKCTSQRNGVAERMNCTLLENVRCMLSQAKLGKEFWAKTVTFASHIINHLPAAANEGKTPLEVWSGSPATNYDSLCIFGCPTHYHVKDSKLDPKAKKAIFLGSGLGMKGYRLWCIETKKIIHSQDVTFNESEFVKPIKQVEESTVENDSQQVEFKTPVVSSKSVNTDNDIEVDEGNNLDESEAPILTPSQSTKSIVVRRSKREIRKPTKYVDVVAYALPIVEEDIPSTYKEAVCTSESGEWKKAMEEKMQSFHKNKT